MDWIHMILVVTGALGGLVYAMRSGLLLIPQSTAGGVRPGFIVDMLNGILGAYVIYLLLPYEPTAEAFSDGSYTVKIVALGLIGGYGGRMLIDRALEVTVKEMGEKIEEDREQRKNDANVIEEVIYDYLDKNADVTIRTDDLIRMIERASLETRSRMFHEARRFRRTHWEKETELMERVIPVFEGLLAAPDGKTYHRNFAQLGFALSNQRDPAWERAIENFTDAIRVRDEKRPGGFSGYEFQRGFCRIELECQRTADDVSPSKIREEIVRDIRTARGRSWHEERVKMLFEDKKLSGWFARNSVQKSDLGVTSKEG